MQIISVQSRCKINIGLEILAKRANGYHDLNTVFQHIRLGDDITIGIDPTGGATTVECRELPELHPQDNLVYKACEKLREYSQFEQSVSIQLHKNLPHGAGLGGGSGDAAAVLFALQATLAKSVSHSKLHELGAELGADVPLFLHAATTLGAETGVHLSPVNLNEKLYSYSCLIVPSTQHISTPKAFGACTPRGREMATDLSAAIALPIQDWRDTILNDFEPGIFALLPELQQTKDLLYDAGAAFALMSGSGSSVYGLFHSAELAQEANAFFKNKALLGTLVRP